RRPSWSATTIAASSGRCGLGPRHLLRRRRDTQLGASQHDRDRSGPGAMRGPAASPAFPAVAGVRTAADERIAGMLNQIAYVRAGLALAARYMHGRAGSWDSTRASTRTSRTGEIK